MNLTHQLLLLQGKQISPTLCQVRDKNVGGETGIGRVILWVNSPKKASSRQAGSSESVGKRQLQAKIKTTMTNPRKFVSGIFVSCMLPCCLLGIFMQQKPCFSPKRDNDHCRCIKDMVR